MKILTACLLALLVSAPLAAQSAADPTVVEEPYPASFRAFFIATDQSFAAKTTFKAAFGQSIEPFLGGGVQVALLNGAFVEVGISRFKKNGQRAVLFNGQTFQLGIPLTATVTPVEFSGGYRFGASRSRRFLPYVAAGVGRYAYKEDASFAAAGDNVDTHHIGYLVAGGVEIRVHRWIGLALDAQYTHISGILGAGGVSKDAGETDLGGIAGRFKVLVGR
jgi:outer membrane protein with beta-barrel domain